jgi:hypothetical protein
MNEATETVSRADHLARCKKRALEYCDAGNVSEAFTSMCSDLQKHEGTRGHCGCELGLNLMLIGDLDTRAKMRRFIEGFN